MIRYYFALTNDCTHSCEYCSCYSRPGKKTYLDFDIFKSYIDSKDEPFEVQFEGGEPLIHPLFYDMVKYCVKTHRCEKIIITTNSSEIGNKNSEIFDWILNLVGMYPKTPFLLKPSINYHLYINSGKNFFFVKMKKLYKWSKEFDNLEILYNVRLDKTEKDKIILDFLDNNLEIKDASNIFNFQRYGYAKNVEKFELPFIIENPVDFHLISSDGKDFGMDLIARSEHMKNLD